VAVVPADAVADKITVTVDDQTAASVGDFAVIPDIANISPRIGAIGSAVVITGTGFSSIPSDNIVKFGGTQATVTLASGSSLTVLVPAGATSNTISVTLSSNTAITASPFQVALEAIGDGGPDFDEGSAVAADNLGNVFVAGSFEGTANFGSTPLTSAGSYDIFIAKYNANYDLVWVKQFGGAGSVERTVRRTLRSSRCGAMDRFKGRLVGGCRGETRYAMVERFRYDNSRPYPGKASVIFWTNGAELHQHPDGTSTFGSSGEAGPEMYMEAELNSPMVRLDPGESYNFDTDWLPTRADAGFQGVTDAGVILKPLHAAQDAGGKIKLAGSFGVFFTGKLVAHFYDSHGTPIGSQVLSQVDPRNAVLVQATVADPGRSGRVSVHLVDEKGLDRGALGETVLELVTGSE